MASVTTPMKSVPMVLKKTKTPPRIPRHPLFMKKGRKTESCSPRKRNSTQAYLPGKCMKKIRFDSIPSQQTVDIRLGGGVNMDSSYGYMATARGLMNLKICECPYEETGSCSCPRGVCPIMGLSPSICQKLFRKGSRAIDVVKQVQQWDVQSRTRKTQWCQRLKSMGWKIDNVLIVDHLGVGIRETHTQINQWFQDIGVPQKLIGYSLAGPTSSYHQESMECGINVGIFAKHFILNNTLDPRGVQHTRSRRRQLILEANQLYGRIQI